MYTVRVGLGNVSSVVHSTRFKNNILSYFPVLEAHCEGRDVLLVANENVGKSLTKACKLDHFREASLCFSTQTMIILERNKSAQL